MNAKPFIAHHLTLGTLPMRDEILPFLRLGVMKE
jgi:hypothetical protein